VNKLDAISPPFDQVIAACICLEMRIYHHYLLLLLLLLVHSPQSRYDFVCADVSTFLQRIGYSETQIRFVPVSAFTGENIMDVSAGCPLLRWYA
jgi:sulfate adenylyltransferase subunit 1 (EFTu-like GTPase family)